MAASINNTFMIAIEITADATGGVNYVVPRACTVVDVHVIASATSGGGTALLSKAGSAITAALAMETANALVRAAAITLANASLVAGDSLRVVTNGAADRGTVYVTCLPAGQALATA